MDKNDTLSEKKGDYGKSDSYNPKSKIELVCQNLDKEIDSLGKYIEEQEKIANKFQIEANAKLKINDKNGKKKALIKKKRYEKQINDYRVPLELLKQQKMILENLMMKKKIFKPVKETNETIKIKDFENIIEDLKIFVNEISESIQNLAELDEEIKNKEVDLHDEKKKIFKTVKEANDAIKEAHEVMKNKDFENIIKEFKILKNFVNEISESIQNQNEDMDKVDDNLEQKKEVDLSVVYQNLDNEIKSLCEHIEELKKISDKCYQEAKENLKTNDKKGAQTTLVKKKRYDKQINYFEESLELLEQQKMILEKLMILKKIFNTTKETNEAIKVVNEISESIQNQNEDTLGKVDDNLEQKNKKKKWIYLLSKFG